MTAAGGGKTFKGVGHFYAPLTCMPPVKWKKIEPWFKLTIPDARLRKMNRAQYYAAQHWLRRMRRLMWPYLPELPAVNPILDCMIYGSSDITALRPDISSIMKITCSGIEQIESSRCVE